MLGDNIKKIMKDKNITAKELAEKIGITPAYLSLILNNKRQNPSLDVLNQISKILDVNLNDITNDSYLRNEEKNSYINESMNEYNFNKELLENLSAIPINQTNTINIPIIGIIRAGKPILAMDNIEGYYPAPKDYLSKDKEYFYLKVKGDSMNLKFQEGSLLLVEKTCCIENGEIGIVLIDGLDATVKKVVKNENMITLIPMSTNAEHIPMMYDILKDDIKIVGKAKMSINFL